MSIKKIQDYTDTELKEAMYQVATNGYILLHDQEFTRQELVDVSRRIGDTNDSNPSMGHMEFNPKDTPDLSICLLYTSPSPRDATLSRMPSSA